MVSSSRPLWGTITVRKATDQKMESGGYRRVESYCWRPPSRIRSELPRNFTFELWCAHLRMASGCFTLISPQTRSCLRERWVGWHCSLPANIRQRSSFRVID